MANFQTSEDIITAVLARIGEPLGGTSGYQTEVVEAVNEAYRDLWNGGGALTQDIQADWWWMKSGSTPGVITLKPRETITASVTNDSASVTLSSSIAETRAGWFLKIDGQADVFRVSTHTAGTAAITLDSVYTGDTNSAAAGRLFLTEYDLETDCLYMETPFRAYQGSQRRVTYLSEQELDWRYPLNEISSGVPDHFTLINDTTVRFSHYGGTSSGDLIRLDYTYIKKPSDLTDNSAEPLVPLKYRSIIVNWATSMLLISKDDDRASAYSQKATRGVVDMYKEHRRRTVLSGKDVARIRPRQRGLFPRGPLRTESGLIIG